MSLKWYKIELHLQWLIGFLHPIFRKNSMCSLNAFFPVFWPTCWRVSCYSMLFLCSCCYRKLCANIGVSLFFILTDYTDLKSQGPSVESSHSLDPSVKSSCKCSLASHEEVSSLKVMTRVKSYDSSSNGWSGATLLEGET